MRRPFALVAAYIVLISTVAFAQTPPVQTRPGMARIKLRPCREGQVTEDPLSDGARRLRQRHILGGIQSVVRNAPLDHTRAYATSPTDGPRKR